jgi:hypothetical protein
MSPLTLFVITLMVSSVLSSPLPSPVPEIADLARKTLLLLGTSGYLLSPTLVSSAKTINPIVRRFVNPEFADPLVNQITELPTDLEAMVNRGLSLLGMNSDDCKQALACEAGKAVGRDFPYYKGYLNSFGSCDCKYGKMLIDAMNGDVEKCPSSCPAISNLEKYWSDLNQKDLVAVSRQAVKDLLAELIKSSTFDPTTTIVPLFNMAGVNLKTRDLELIKTPVSIQLTRAMLQSLHDAL